MGEMVDLASSWILFKKSGSWFSMGRPHRPGPGRRQAVFLKDNPDVAAECGGSGPGQLLQADEQAVQAAAKAAGRAVTCRADDFDDGAPADD